MMTALALLVAIPMTGQTMPQEVNQPSNRAHSFVFLDTAPNAPSITDIERTRLQGEHLTALQVMYEQRKAFLIGPIENGGDHRGMLIVDMASDAALAALNEDPYVKAGQMVPRVIPVMGNVAMFKQATEFMDLTARQLVIFRDKAEIPPQRPETVAKIQADTVLFLVEFDKTFSVPYRATPTDPGDLREIWVVDSTDTEKVKAMFARDPRVQAGTMDIQILTFQSTKDTFLPQSPR